MYLLENEYEALHYTMCEGKGTFVESYAGVDKESFYALQYRLKEDGYTVVSAYDLWQNTFAVMEKGGDAVYLAYYPSIREMRAVSEPNSAYLTFADTPGKCRVQPLITQIDLEDFGLSYVIRLSDGRFILLDGGWMFEPEADKLMQCLREQSPDAKPVIAAWIMTHPHLDHYRAYFPFAEKYAGQYVLERFIYNFPDAVEENVPLMPELASKADKEMEFLPLFDEAVAKSGVPVYRAHTGQKYKFADTEIEILSSPDDTLIVPVNFNDISLMMKMHIAGQTVLWTGDAQFGKAKMADRWGTYLKSDMYQMAHHGFNGGEIRSYNLIDPTVLLWPGFDFDCFGAPCYWNDFNQHILYNLNVQDVITGGRGTVTLALPYTPRKNGRKLLFDRIEHFQKGAGVKTWIFDGMTKKDCIFTIYALNGANEVYADLIFENSGKKVTDIKISLRGQISEKNLFDPADADPDALFFNRTALAKVEITEEDVFTVRFRSERPIIVKGTKEPLYFA